MDGGDDERDAGRDAGRIRKRRFSSARIQPTRIKKVMQSDEDIGRMIASVPVAIGSAMEHFAEKLLESAAQCVQVSSARTLTPAHLRYAILKNRHFSFLEELTGDIPTPRGEEIEQSSTSKAASNTGFPLDQVANFSPVYPQQQQNFPFPQQMISDLNANTSHQRPVQFTKEQEAALVKTMPALSMKQDSEVLRQSPVSAAPFNIPKIPIVAKTSIEVPGEGKRKRGRPRKDRKEKFVEGVSEASCLATSSATNGAQQTQVPTTPEEMDRMRMPPPSFSRRSVPTTREPSVNNENSDSTCTTSNRTSNSTKTSLTAV